MESKTNRYDSDEFELLFDEKVLKIQDQITLASNNKQLNSQNDIENIKYNIQELQQFLTNSTLFLTDYKVNSSQNIIKKLIQECDQVNKQPKKKFGFKKKNVVENVGEKLQPQKICNPESKIVTNLFHNTIVNKRCEHIIMKNEEINNKDISLMNIENCVVEIQGSPGSIQLNNIKNSIILSGPVLRAIFVELAVNSSFAVACQQLRIHSSCNCQMSIHVSARAIIEDCKGIVISKYNYQYENIENDFLKSEIQSKNNYKDVADFNWLSSDIPSPNWSISEEPFNWETAIKKMYEENKLVPFSEK